MKPAIYDVRILVLSSICVENIAYRIPPSTLCFNDNKPLNKIKLTCISNYFAKHAIQYRKATRYGENALNAFEPLSIHYAATESAIHGLITEL
ncbi:hypothetical protein VNO78_11275 [Psophocarpus tetragonolobus]|uniref:Uncharacterized protein n=1 Tax=Psophocarpus tetragonolobus TaxID=3891 RepID=A0AAN9XNI4_PSOTE